MRRAVKFRGALVQVIAWWSGNAQAEQFLSLPTSTSFPITCRWTCPNPGGSTYYHNATDYGTPTSSEIRAASGGEVILVEDGLQPRQRVNKKPYGNHVRIRHSNGYETRYAHLLPNTITVQREQRVEAGQLLGLSDNTGVSSGPHLHFEVRDPQGRRVNPYGDPADYTGGCGPNVLWLTCPPTPAPPPDADGDGFTAAAGDCDDANRDVHPGATESCNDRDDDCSGTADDPWRVGLTQDLGNPCTVGLGACANTGTWVCAPNGLTAVCSVDPLPSQPERCDAIDNDCDGESDEDWRTSLATDLGEPCTIEWGSGACVTSTTGTWACSPDGLAVVCDAPEPPGGARDEEEEGCNGIDDDCNEIVDDVHYNNVAYDEAHCGACDAPACAPGSPCIQAICRTCTTGRNVCTEHCLVNHCVGCSSWDCGSGYGSCLSSCRPEDFIDLRYFNCLCWNGCSGC